MSDRSSTAARQPQLGFIKNPQDFWGGSALVLLAAIAWWASRTLPGQQGFAFGPGTAPRMFMLLLAAVGLTIMLQGVFTWGPQLERWYIRGPLFVTGAVLLFAVMIRPIGLVVSSFLLAFVSSFATPETRLHESLIWSAILSAFCAFLFPYVLNLPMQLWPRFW